MSARKIDRSPAAWRPAAAVACGLLAATALLAACGGAGGPLEVSVGQLREKPDVYVGDEVSVSGSIVRGRVRGEPSFLLIDDQGRTILLEPRGRASAAAGGEVTVEGVFVLDLGGRPVLRIEAAEPPAPE